MTRRATQMSGERRRSRRRAKRSLLMTLGLLAGVTSVIAVSRSFRGRRRARRSKGRDQPVPRDLLTVLAHRCRR